MTSPRTLQRSVVVLVVLLGAGLYAASLFHEVAHYARVSKSAVYVLTIGWLGPIAGQVGWYANGLLLCSWILAFFTHRKAARIALILSLVAVAVGGSSWATLARDDALFGRHEGESSGAFLAFGHAIYLWSAALLTGPLAAGVAYVCTARRAKS